MFGEAMPALIACISFGMTFTLTDSADIGRWQNVHNFHYPYVVSSIQTGFHFSTGIYPLTCVSLKQTMRWPDGLEFS